jgi:hypothetical protein
LDQRTWAGHSQSRRVFNKGIYKGAHGFFVVDRELPLEVCGPLLSALEARAHMSRILENEAYRVYEMSGVK